MKEVEIVSLRKEREKHFLKENGEMMAKVYSTPIHFKKGNIYEEIDNTLIKENNYYKNRNNDYEVHFMESTNNLIMKMIKDNHFLEIKLNDENNSTVKVMDKKVIYHDILPNIDLEYLLLPTKVKENLILKNNDISKISFIIKTNLELVFNNNKIDAISNGIRIFTFEPLFMIDNKQNINHNIYYHLIPLDLGYQLDLILDEEWLSNASYPVIIDPTITNDPDKNTVYDTYIYPNDNGKDKNSHNYLKAGVDRINGVDVVNRTLIKFNLPVIGTGSQIISASLNLNNYGGSSGAPVLDLDLKWKLFDVHRLTKNWNESTANWDSMYNQYDSKIENYSYAARSYWLPPLDGVYEILTLRSAEVEITDLVKKWYSGTPNYGVMVKSHIEEYTDDEYAAFFSNQVADLAPTLTIHYRNQNGLESYMNYLSQGYAIGSTSINTYNGNLVGQFHIGSTKGEKNAIGLSLIYNTNDVILNSDYKLGQGYKFNYHQTIEEEKIQEETYLKYVDSDGTIHYFLEQLDDNGESTGMYVDEDGLNLTITKDNTNYIMLDKYGNTNVFNIVNKVGYLATVTDTENQVIQVIYDDNNRIIKVIDPNLSEINVTYNDNNIIVISPDEEVTLTYEDNKLISINNLVGSTLISYNTNFLIENITDINGLKIKYEYYEEIPYRIKKVSEYSISNTIGNYFDVEYSYNSTTITDNKNRVQTMTFNNNGNLISTSSLANKTNLKEAYSISNEYLEIEGVNNQYKNKLLSATTPIKYVKNLLTNTSFEEDIIDFISEGNPLELTSEYVNNGLKSLKGTSTFYQDVGVENGKYYTFSAYIKNNQDITLSLSYDNEVKEVIVKSSSEFKRSDITIFYPDTAISNLKIKFNLLENTTIYIDDIQLEEGEIVNNYNMISNSDFSLGYNDWTLTAGQYGNFMTGDEEITILDNSECFSIVDVDDNGNKAIRIKMAPNRYSYLSKTFPIKGKKGDAYEISFWYKDEGLYARGLPGEDILNNVRINFNFTEEDEMGVGTITPVPFNPNRETWQYYRFTFVAEQDYEGITLSFEQNLNINDMYITNICLFKDPREIRYDYDTNGNIVSSSNLSNNVNDFKYDSNNQLIKMTDPQGKNLTYEYDNLYPERLLNGISETGINNGIKYDSFGNPIATKISHRINSELIDGLYKIRSKGTNDYLKNTNNACIFNSDDCNHDLWNITKVNNEYYTISHNIINDNYFSANENQILLSPNNSNKALFKLIKQDNNSYYIEAYYEEDEPILYVKRENDVLILTGLMDDDPSFEFYLETVEDEFIESSAEYTEDGRFIKSVTDSNLNKVMYDIDSLAGLLNKKINPNGIETTYIYDEKRRVSKIIQNNKEINYTYNSNNLISKIIDDNKEYNFIYNEFLRVKEIKIGDNINLVTYNYEDNNGNLISSIYGNNHTISYTYDEFDRIKMVNKMNDTYKYYYDSKGNLTKLESNDSIIKYIYDLSQKINEYNFNNFKIKYTYDTCDNVIAKNYILDNTQNSINHTLNKEAAIIKTEFDNNSTNYNYDSLGRLISKNINNIFNTTYHYLTNGKRTSLLVDTFSNNDDIYNYKYDKLCNITHIYHNNTLKHQYSYDKYNQLLEEKNYIDNEIIRYTYDNYGNILNRKVLDINTYSVKLEDKYEYNNSNWLDQLTKFNELNITYDNIGNPLTIGNDVLTWANGRQLNSYNNNNYKYDHNGIRTSKIVNGIETKYYLEGTSIIFEKRDNNMIYYIRNGIDNLIGFKYNDNIYYYVKNIQNDIIGILDSNCNLIVNYKYDSWGNILSITDSNGNEITDSNHIGIINPFRYRSYYYDVETNLYYLNSRYYSPMLKRFLNADGILGANQDIMAYNLYAYCSNNSITFYDPNGKFMTNLKNDIKKRFTEAITAAQKRTCTYNVQKETITNTCVPKVISRGDVRNIINSVAFANISIFIGTGPGSSIGNGNYSFGTYQDRGFRYKDGKWEIGNTQFIGVKGIAPKKPNAQLYYEQFHPYHMDSATLEENIEHTQFYVKPSVILGCPLTEHSNGLELEYDEHFSGDFNLTFCFGSEFHMGWGYHAKICFDL